MELIPAILETSAAGIQAKLDALSHLPHVRLAQIDVADASITKQSLWHQPEELRHLRWAGQLELHLMQMSPPLAAWLIDSRVVRCVVHAEASHPDRLLAAVRAAGRAAGLAMNPPTTVEQAARYLPGADYVLLMTVEPGAQGQSFHPEALSKATAIRQLEPDIQIYVDGGVRPETIGGIIAAGCDGAAVGSYLWNTEDAAVAWKRLESAAAGHRVIPRAQW